MSNIMNDLKVKNHVSRNGFDRSQRVCFTAKVGEILPVSFFDILPGDSLRMKLNSFGRTQPVQTATFARFREYYDVFFVPYRLLWDKFPAFIVGSSNAFHAKNDKESVPNFPSMPYTTLGRLFYTFTAPFFEQWDAKNSGRDYITYDDGGLPQVETAARLLRYLGYPFDVYMEKDTSYPGYYKFKEQYSNPTSDTLLSTAVSIMPILAYQKVYQDYFRFPQWEQAAPQSYNLDYILSDSTLDLSIPNHRQLSMRYCNYDKDYFLGRMPNSQFGDVANITAYINPDDTKMDVALNGAEVYLGGNVVASGYQGQGTTTMEWTAGLHSSSAWINTTRLDKNNIVLPMAEPGTELDSPDGTNIDNKLTLYQAAGGTRPYADLQGLYTQFTILALRRAQAVQKLREITQLSSPDYKSQMAAHWNVKVSDSESYLCKHLGGCAANLDVSEVINNNLAADSDIASIHGRGIITGNGSLDYKFNEYGILLVTYHVKPIPEYEQTKIFNRNLFKLKQTDFPQPEFDRIGMQELHYFEANMDAAASETGETDKAFEPIGYVPRYCEYKTNVDVIKGEFLNTLKPWVLPFTQYSEPNSESSSYLQFKVKANVADNIFGLQATSDSSTDVFLNSLYIDAKFVSNLDRNGMPY